MLLHVWYFLLVGPCFVHLSVKANEESATTDAGKPDSKDTDNVSLRDCGISPKNLLIRKRRDLLVRNKRVVGGKQVNEGDWPWMAALLEREPEEYFCGGTLLHTYKHVLTAYHCVEKYKADDIIVRLGLNDLSQTNEDTSDHLVSEIILHPGFNKRTRENNIAILVLKVRANPSDYIRPICLPTGRLVPGQMTFVAGWGATHNSGAPNDVLMETTLPVWRTELCNQTLDRAISSLQFCAGWKSGEKDTCAKDGGSPMMLQTESGRWEIVGIVGASRGCARANTPGIYTRISSYTHWIVRNIPVNVTNSTTVPQGCGKPTDDAVRRIVSGVDAEPGMWPWMASIQLNNEKEHACGGVLITNQHVLTATHCVKDSKIGDLHVRLGEHDLEQESESERNFSVERIWTAANYSHRLLKNDIAILRLSKTVSFSDDIKNVCLPSKETDLTDAKVVVIGWGQTSFFGSLSPTLQQAGLSVLPLQECQQSYPRLRIDNNQLCATHKKAGRDSCQGDSGGPLLYQQANGRWSVVGIVSGGQGCGDPTKPGIYTRVSAYVDWIKSTVLFAP